MMEWFVLLIGENSDLEELSNSLNSPELCVIQKNPPEPPGPDFILKLTDFNFIEDTDDVINMADEIISEINGAARLFIGLRKHIWGISLGVSASTPIVSADGTVHDQENIHQVDSIPGCIAIARHDVNVAKVLRLYGADDHDWVSLYRIYEVIESDVGNIAKKGWATKNEIKRFAQTANSPDASGDDSRHGAGNIPPPKDPMPISEAKFLVKTIIHKWLRSK